MKGNDKNPGNARRRLKSLPAALAKLATKRIILTVPSRIVRELRNPEEVMQLWDRVMDADADLARIPRDRQWPERIVLDVQISAGYMHSGYPIMAELDAEMEIVTSNSDPWLVEHHEKIRKMRPRLLVLNFSNGFSRERAEQMTRHLIGAIAESTRYRGYADKNAPAFIDYELFRLVDLQDAMPYPKTPDGNSTKYPRAPSGRGINFVYKDLYSDTFAGYYGVEDPDNPDHFLRLHELVDRGFIHELWFFAYQRDAGAPFECTEWKPVYDEQFRRVPGQHRHAGNGGDPDEPWHGRSLRISFINAERGIGCSMESLAHAIEGTANSAVIPYFTKYFREYAGFDLDKRFGLPFNSLYACDLRGTQLAFPGPHTLSGSHAGKPFRVEDYFVVGGNAHFTPSSRDHYDLDNPAPVLSTIEHYRQFDGPDGKDRAEPWTIEKFRVYRMLAPDCMGPWLVYWRQNMPGLDNKSKADDGRPMKNWWPFMFY